MILFYIHTYICTYEAHANHAIMIYETRSSFESNYVQKKKKFENIYCLLLKIKAAYKYKSVCVYVCVCNLCREKLKEHRKCAQREICSEKSFVGTNFLNNDRNTRILNFKRKKFKVKTEVCRTLIDNQHGLWNAKREKNSTNKTPMMSKSLRSEAFENPQPKFVDRYLLKNFTR